MSDTPTQRPRRSRATAEPKPPAKCPLALDAAQGKLSDELDELTRQMAALNATLSSVQAVMDERKPGEIYDRLRSSEEKLAVADARIAQFVSQDIEKRLREAEFKLGYVMRVLAGIGTVALAIISGAVAIGTLIVHAVQRGGGK